jgi:hypothetical protein
METERKEHDEPEYEDEGPIVLPPGACCGTCAYSATVEVEVPGKIATRKEARRFCRRNPPLAMLIPTGPQTATLAAQFPPVADESVCFEYDMAPVNLVGANG